MKRAFSLIEILVVVAIIALVAALLFPVFAQAKKQARTTVCLSNLRQLGVAVQLYQADYNGALPPGSIRKWKNTMGNGSVVEGGTREVIAPLLKYAGGPKALECPENDQLFVPRWVRSFEAPHENRLAVPNPTMVLAECHHHLLKGWSGGPGSETYTSAPTSAQQGVRLALKIDGSVEKVQAPTVSQWVYERVKGKDVWTPYGDGEYSAQHNLPYYDVFPGEIWPPEWEVLPEFYSLNWGYGG